MNTEEKFIKGFNHGYTLAKHEPDFLSNILKGLRSSNNYIEGIYSGKEEFEIEKSRAHLDDLSRIRNKSRDREKGLERE